MLSTRLSHVTRRQIQHVVAVASHPSPMPSPVAMTSRRLWQGSSCSALVRSSSHHDDDASSHLSFSTTSVSTSASPMTSTTTQTVLITAVGLDRVGIVHDMTKEVIQVGGNVGSSQAAKLGNYFSFMMLVHVPPTPPTSTTTTATDATTTAVSAVETLTKNLQNIQDLSVIVANATATATSTSTSTTTTIGYKGRLTLEGADNPGIVNKVTKILSNNGLNINTLETSDEVAPHGGTVLFRMKGTAHAYEPLSSGFNATKMKQELSELGDDLNCDIELLDESESESE